MSIYDFATQVEEAFPNVDFVFSNSKTNEVLYQAHSISYSVQFSTSGRWHVVDAEGNLGSATTLSMALNQLNEYLGFFE